jgi:hypothetical protein
MRLIFILFFFLNLNLRARYAPQIKDFLCGCDYCETVLPGEPLVIGRHMIMCDSWRESTMNTFRIMQEMKQQKLNDKHGVPIEDTLPTYSVPSKHEQTEIEENFSEEPKTIHNDHTWRVHDVHGWNYSATAQNLPNSEGWIYREDIKWVWTFSEKENFLYSVDYGWFYAMSYKNYRLLYWYDRKYWLFANNFWWKK